MRDFEKGGEFICLGSFLIMTVQLSEWISYTSFLTTQTICQEYTYIF